MDGNRCSFMRKETEMLQQFLSATNRSVRLLMVTLLGAILFTAASPQAHADLNPYSRFTKVEKWSFHWTVTIQGSGDDVVDDWSRHYEYSAGSSGTVEMEAEYPRNPFGQTWRSPEDAAAQGEVLYSETVYKSNGKTRTIDVLPVGPGAYNDSFPLSIDAVRGIYNISIPLINVDSRYAINDEGNLIEETIPFSIVPWPLDAPYAVPKKYWDAQPLPAEGLTLSGSYSFTTQMPSPVVYIPAGVFAQVSYTITPLGEKDDLKAVPKVSTSVERGEAVELDGTGSTGDIDTYEWSFKPLAPGPPQPDTSVKIERETATVVLLKSMLVTLTVKDGKKSDKKTVAVQVRPRSWELPFEQVADEGTLPAGMGGKPYYRSGGSIQYSGGENVCAIDPPQSDADPPHIIHPKKDDSNSWNDNGYGLEQVQDDGPFNGWWYVKEQTIEVQRQVLINQYILPAGPVIFAGMEENFYNANMSRGRKADAYLAAARAHESDHTTKMRNALVFYDPAKRLEKAMTRDRDELKNKADAIIQRAEDLMSRATSDCRMPVTWRGELVVPDDATYVWTPVSLQVGGAPDGCR